MSASTLSPPSPDLLRMLDDVLGLGGRARAFTRDTVLLGALPELDSMAVTSLLTAFESEWGVAIADDDVQTSDFETVGALADFVERLRRQA